MATPAAAPEIGQPRKSRHAHGVIEHTLADISRALEHSLFAEEIAHRQGLLQSLDPRAKVLALIALLIAVALAHNLAVIAGLYVVTLALAWRSVIPLGFFIKRVWLFLPFFTGVIALPALFLTPGPPLAQLPLGLTITSTGMQTALFLLFRVSTSVSLAAPLIFSTPWNDVLKSFGVLRVPDAVILIFGMTYRYIYLLLRTANDMFLSRKSRVLRRLSGADERRMVSASTGVLLGKSLHMSSEVYLAMQLRGFRGHARAHSMTRFEMRPRDWLFIAMAAGITALAIWLGR
jgi:cobalt/nickel transport system permease protein